MHTNMKPIELGFREGPRWVFTDPSRSNNLISPAFETKRAATDWRDAIVAAAAEAKAAATAEHLGDNVVDAVVIA